MNKIIAYVGPGFSEAESQKIAETLRMRQIETTNIKKNATLVILAPTDVPGFGMTLEKLAETIVETYYQEIIKFSAQLPVLGGVPDIPKSTQTKYPHFVVQRAIKQYNQTKQKLFNRTQCK